jgi:predicted transcriptional regulator
MSEPDIFYILGNKVRRDLLGHLTCTECYFSLLSSRVNVSSTAVSKHLKIMEREGVIQAYEKEEQLIGPMRKYYKISVSNTYIATITPNLFWYKGISLEREPAKEHLVEYSIDLQKLNLKHENLHEMVNDFLKANEELEEVLAILQKIETYRDWLIKMIKEKYLKEIGDMTQLAVLHYLLLNGEATIEELSDKLNLKEREVLKKAEELSKFVPLIIKDSRVKIDTEALTKSL